MQLGRLTKPIKLKIKSSMEAIHFRYGITIHCSHKRLAIVVYLLPQEGGFLMLSAVISRKYMNLVV